MSRQRPDHEIYHGRHRKDRLPPPDPPPPRIPRMMPAPVAPELVTDERAGNWSEWYDPSRLRGIDPDLISPVDKPEEEIPIQPRPKWAEPKRKMQPRTITALTTTFIVAVPALLCAGWVMRDSADANTIQYSQLAPNTAHIPVSIAVRGKPVRICMALSNTGSTWRAWQTSERCLVALAPVGHYLSSRDESWQCTSEYYAA